MINKVILLGYVGNDPEIKSVGESQRVANFSLATSESYTDKNGERQTITEWHRCQAWRGLADVVEKYITKGKQLYIDGKIRTRSWDDNGTKKFATEIIVENLKMVGGNRSEGSSSQPSQPSSYPSASQPMDDGGDDLPF